ncbi:MAG: hypothetical protein IKH33_05055 [Bacteroidales bacterium]|nr:hypothetical protein [Bacteroidales bacterium]
MKKTIILLALTVLLFASCRKESDYLPYIGESHKLAYSTYEEQFVFLWKSISAGYVFWDVDTTDWDEVYNHFLPRFQELDRHYSDSGYVSTDELVNMYGAVFGGMIDHHMTVVVQNLHPIPGDEDRLVVLRPGQAEVKQRDYYLESNSQARASMLSFLGGIESEGYTIVEHESGTFPFNEGAITSSVTYHYILFQLPDGRLVPYLWQSMAAFTPVIRSLGSSTPTGAGASLLDHWLHAITDTPRSQLAGIILDNRANNGGYQDDLDYLIGTFLNERAEVMQTRYKEGPGRMEYSQWTPYYIYPNKSYHRDITAENIPYVILCDINSASMGEIEPLCAKHVLPTVHTIGERTYGATGPLQPVTDINLNYGGPFGDGTNYRGHYIYTSTFEANFDGQVLEGIGYIPDQIILRKDCNSSYKPQLDAAFDYIAAY